MKRIFVVGCPRSGTTVVQSLLAGHQDLGSFPETHIFTSCLFDLEWRMYGNIIGRREFVKSLYARFKNNIGISAPYVENRMDQFLRNIDMNSAVLRHAATTRQLNEIVQLFVKALDKNGGALGWIEKTPNNVFCVNLIERYIKNPLFVHVVREGSSTVSSIVDASQKYPDWDRRYLQNSKDVKRVCMLWKRSVSASLRLTKKTNHSIVFYEDLVNDPTSVLEDLSKFVNMQFDKDKIKLSTEGLILSRERWKQNVGKEISKPKNKTGLVLSKEEKAFVDKEISEVEKRRQRMRQILGKN